MDGKGCCRSVSIAKHCITRVKPLRDNYRLPFQHHASAAQAVLKKDGHQIDKYVISVAISNPPERKTPLSTRMDPPARTMNLGSGKKESEFRGKARTQVALLPRAVRQQGNAPSQQKPATSSSEKSSDDNSSNSTQKSSNGSAMSNEDFRKMLLK